MKKILFSILATAAIVCGCAREMEPEGSTLVPSSKYLVISADCSPMTKTDIVEGKSTWEKGDKITVLYNGEAYEYVADGDYYGTFVTFFEKTEAYLIKGIPSNQYNYDINTGEVEAYQEPLNITVGEIMFALVAALVSAAATIGMIKAKYQLKFEDFHYDAYTDSEVQLSVKSDRLVNKFITHRRIPKNDNSSGGSSGGGGSRSSVHTSSSGRSHGGGGRSF